MNLPKKDFAIFVTFLHFFLTRSPMKYPDRKRQVHYIDTGDKVETLVFQKYLSMLYPNRNE